MKYQVLGTILQTLNGNSENRKIQSAALARLYCSNDNSFVANRLTMARVFEKTLGLLVKLIHANEAIQRM
jgi:hypothetical protein